MFELLISKGADINAKDIIYLNIIIFFFNQDNLKSIKEIKLEELDTTSYCSTE